MLQKSIFFLFLDLSSFPFIRLVHLVGVNRKNDEAEPDESEAGKFPYVDCLTKDENGNEEHGRWRNELHQTEGRVAKAFGGGGEKDERGGGDGACCDEQKC